MAASGIGTDADDTCPAVKTSDLSLTTAVALFNKLPSPSSEGAREIKLRVFYDSMFGILKSLNVSA